ncbi:MAG TPA: SDR family oxidoreductase [Acidobacteriaceae bacterium]|jgi:enoyl-[acyl-carrier protein] reductase III|nr:SDR family oxidoreductase [Acidobacteriaceae bacterium]
MAATTIATDPFSLHRKAFLVAGGTRGIGNAISLRFARAGATVIANYLRNEQSAEQLRVIAEKEQLPISLCRADLTTDKGLEQVNHAVLEIGSHLSGMVFCAATGIHRPMGELTDRHFDFTFNLNVRAFFRLMKLFQTRFSPGASVVAVSSWGAVRTLPCYSLVGSSKGALESMARHFAAELAPAGVRVNILTAGAVLTEAWKAMPNSGARIAETIHRTPAGRLVTAEEVACGAQFLCSDAAAGIVGHTLVVDGGCGIVA